MDSKIDSKKIREDRYNMYRNLHKIKSDITYLFALSLRISRNYKKIKKFSIKAIKLSKKYTRKESDSKKETT
jgi:hypothetical protein